MSARLDRVMTGLEQGDGTAGQLLRDRQLYENMNAAVGELRKLVADIRGITTGLNDVASRLQKGEGSLGKMMTDETLYQRLDSMAQQFERLATRMESGEGSMGKLMRDPEFYNNLNGAARDLRNLIEEVKKDPQKYLRLKLSVF